MVMRLARTVAEPTAKNGFLFTILGSKWGFLWLWLLIINVLALLAYGLDKLLAKLKEHAPKTRRIPEKTLLLLAALGGGIGAWLGMELFRHKTQHRSFRICVPPVHPDLDRCYRRAVPLFQRHQIIPGFPSDIPGIWQYPVPLFLLYAYPN